MKIDFFAKTWLFGTLVADTQIQIFSSEKIEKSLSNEGYYFLAKNPMEDRLLPLWRPEIEMVEELRSFLREKLIGQNEAIDEIVNLFVSRAVRTDDDRRPFMSVFLNGTSGVGKTLIFELIHEFLNDHPSIRKSGGRIPITKISLN